MGNCYGCVSSYFKNDYIVDPLSVSLHGQCIDTPYTVFLKLPHGKTVAQIKNDQWTFQTDVNIAIKDLYRHKTFHTWIVYNDETPNMTHSTGAHAKGIMAWNDTCVSWLIHSVPKFPSQFSGTADFPDISSGELQYGQSFVHISAEIDQLKDLLRQLFVMKPNIYITNYDYYEYKDLYKSCQSNIYKIGDELYHVAKSPEYHVDLYEHIVQPQFGGHLITETWVRGHECPDTSTCTMAKEIVWSNGVSYTYTHDHSKYCYSDNEWIMVGDLNRMTTQFKRGGGGVVVKNATLAQLFREIMAK